MRQRHVTGHDKPYLARPEMGMAYRALSCLLLILCVVLAGGNAALVGHAQTESHAGLVVQFSDGTTNTYCIPFEGGTISGLDLLIKTGLDITAETQGALGAWVCRIGPDGCNFPEESCVCQSYGPGGKYWVYSHLRDGAWKFSPQGASNYKVRNGEVDGWAWSSGKGPSVTPSFTELCAAVLPAQPEPTATTPPPPPPTNTPIPPPTNTPLVAPPTSTSQPLAPTATRRPQATPTPVAPTATIEPPTATSRPTDTPTILPTNTATVMPTDTQTPTVAPTRTQTPVPTATPLPTAIPTAIAHATGPAPQVFAQMVAVGIGLAVLGGLAIWWFGLRGRRL